VFALLVEGCILVIMKPSKLDLFELQAGLCQVMANPKRIAIVDILSAGESNVGDLAEALTTSISTVSQHLRIMKDKNVVASRKDAQTVYYHLVSPRLVESCHIMREVLQEELSKHCIELG